MAFYYFNFSAFKEQGKISGAINSAYTALKNQMRDKNKFDQQNLADLENFLNSVFYPKNKSDFSENYEQAQKYISQKYQEVIQSIFNNFNMETFSSSVQKGVEEDNRKSFRTQTLRNALEAAKANLEILSNMQSSGSINEYLEIKDKIEGIIKNTNIDELPKSIFINNNQDIYTSLMTLNAFNKIFSSEKNISNKEAGENFEKALAEAVTQITDEGVSELIQSIKGAKKTGDKPIYRGIDNIGGATFAVDYSIDEDIKKQLPQGFVLEEKNMTVKYDPGSKKMGKMDVIFNIDGGDVPDIRISAKRWKHGIGDFGETSIDAGISRAGGISIAEAYKLAVLTEVIKKEIKAHDYARLALASDIILGLNQGVQAKGGYANVLIVDDGSHIHVKSLFDIAYDSQTKIRDYSDSEIEGAANNAYRQIKNLRDGRTSAYFYKMTSTLNKMKVTIDYSVK